MKDSGPVRRRFSWFAWVIVPVVALSALIATSMLTKPYFAVRTGVVVLARFDDRIDRRIARMLGDKAQVRRLVCDLLGHQDERVRNIAERLDHAAGFREVTRLSDRDLRALRLATDRAYRSSDSLAWALRCIGGESVDVLIADATKPEDSVLISDRISILLKKFSAQADQSVSQLARSATGWRRQAIIAGITAEDLGPECVAVLEESARHPNPLLRKAVGQSLRHLSAPQAAGLLPLLIGDRDAEVRMSALVACHRNLRLIRSEPTHEAVVRDIDAALAMLARNAEISIRERIAALHAIGDPTIARACILALWPLVQDLDAAPIPEGIRDRDGPAWRWSAEDAAQELVLRWVTDHRDTDNPGLIFARRYVDRSILDPLLMARLVQSLQPDGWPEATMAALRDCIADPATAERALQLLPHLDPAMDRMIALARTVALTATDRGIVVAAIDALREIDPESEELRRAALARIDGGTP